MPYAKKRFIDESTRLLGVLEKQLVASGSGFVCSCGLSLADFTVGPWIARLTVGLKDGPIPFADFPEVGKYAEAIRAMDSYKVAAESGKASE